MKDLEDVRRHPPIKVDRIAILGSLHDLIGVTIALGLEAMTVIGSDLDYLIWLDQEVDDRQIGSLWPADDPVIHILHLSQLSKLHDLAPQVRFACRICRQRARPLTQSEMLSELEKVVLKGSLREQPISINTPTNQ